MQIDVFERWRFTARVVKADVFKANAIRGIRPCRLLTGLLRYFVFQIFSQIGQVEIVLIHAVHRGQAVGHGILAEPKLGNVHGHLTNSDGSADGRKADPAIGKIESGTGQQPENVAPQTPAQNQITVFGVDAAENIDVALQEQFPQLQQLHFLHTIFARQHHLQIDLHASLRRAAPMNPKRLTGEFCLGNESRYAGKR